MCRRHYSRWQRHGDPLVTGRRRFQYTDDLVADFWRLVDKSAGPDECWHWQGTVTVHGYGGWLKFPAHRFAFALERGPIADDLVIDHVCHDPALCTGGPRCPHRRCVNPNHLKAVPASINVSPARSSMRRRSDDERCSADGCEMPYVALDLCTGHYQRFREHGDTFPERPLGERPRAECAIDECERLATKRGWCDMHWKRWKRTGDPLTVRKPGTRADTTECTVEDCDKPLRARRLCSGHYQRLLKHGDPLPGKPLRGA